MSERPQHTAGEPGWVAHPGRAVGPPSEGCWSTGQLPATHTGILWQELVLWEPAHLLSLFPLPLTY